MTPSPELDALPCPWLKLSAAGTIVAHNAAAAQLVGAATQSLAGRPFERLLTGPSLLLYQTLLQPLLKLHGHVAEIALSVKVHDGQPIDVLLYAATVPGKSGEIQVQLAPIRQRRRIELELARVKRAADQAPGMVFHLERTPDGQWRFPYVSEAALHLYGVSADEAARSADAIFARVAPDDRRELMRALEASGRVGGPVRVMMKLQPSNDAVDAPLRWHELQALSRQRADGTIWWHGHVADVTERITMQEAVANARAMEQLARMRSEFIARVSHELRTPLNGILGFTELLREDAESPPSQRQRERLDVVLSSAHHLLAVVNQLLDVTSIETGRVQLAVEPILLQDALTQARRVVDTAARQRAIELHLNVPALPLYVSGDAQRLQQLLLNLLSNAIKYNRAGGRVDIEAGREGGVVAIRVSDTGQGLTEAQRASLFQPFNRLGAERTGVDGAGLGLVLAKHLVELMSGSIDVDSTPGVGSTFTVRLLAADAAPAGAVAAVASPHHAEASSGHVLYVEDNEVNALLMQAILAARPAVELTVAVDAANAIDCIRARQPDLILLDLNLPDSTGDELLTRMRLMPGLSAIPAIAVSASAGPDAELQARRAGFDGYWTKPLSPTETLRELDRWLCSAVQPGR